MRKIYQIFFMLLFVSFIGQMRAQQTVNIRRDALEIL